MIILDFGSGNTTKNDINYVKRMIDELKAVDSGKHEIVIKWQLFTKAEPNIPLRHGVFEYAYNYAKELGYKTTASVFDIESLKFLLQFDPCFVKIANNRKLDYLIGEIPRKIPVFVSVGCEAEFYEFEREENVFPMVCVSNYPAKLRQYINKFDHILFANQMVSDHVCGIELYRQWKPSVWEKHFVLEYDPSNPDGGSFATTPTQLSEIIG